MNDLLDGLPMLPPPERRFCGETYDPALDCARLTGQLLNVYAALRGGEWHTLHELSEKTGGSEASVSARLRDLRKPAFGSHVVDRRRRADGGLHEYRLVA